MRVVILGPNLRDQSKGTFRVHREGCRDILLHSVTDERSRPDEYATKREVVEDIYPPEQFEWEDPNDQAYWGDVWFAPCTKDLPDEW